MIALVFAMVWVRRGQAVLLALLSMFAVASAVAAPAYLSAADRAVAAGQFAAAGPEERSYVASARVDGRAERDGAPPAPRLGVPGFTDVQATEFPVVGLDRDPRHRSRFVHRQDVCAHLRMVTGRCLIGVGEIVVGARTAAQSRLVAGQTVTLTFAVATTDAGRRVYVADGLPATLTVVGTYRVPEPQDAYWGLHGYFTGDAGRPGEPVFTNAATLAATDHGDAVVSIDGTAEPAVLDVADLDALRAELDTLQSDAAVTGTASVDTRIPALLDRIEAGRAAAGRIVPVVAVPLVLLACMTIFLATGYGVEGRRPELAVVALRGLPWWTRWWLGTGETLVAILAGALAGLVAGPLLVGAVAAVWLPGADVVAGPAALRYAPVAAGAALLAALLAQRRPLFTPVAGLLRRSAAAGGAARELAVEAVVALLAALAVAQLLLSGGELTGVAVFAPALAALALAAAAARVGLPLVSRFAARALRRGRLAVALAAFPMVRRAGAGRLFALLVAAIAVIGYATCAVDVAAQGRADEATVGTGAARVLSLESAVRPHLLNAVRTVDPEGAFAMAVVRLPARNGEKPGLAVDSTRLARVAYWPDDAPAAADVARALRVPVAPSVVVPGRDVTVRVTADGIPASQRMWLYLALSAPSGQDDFTVEMGALADGPRRYRRTIEACRDGCRLKGIRLRTQGGVTAVRGAVTITGIGAGDPAAEALRDPQRWHTSDGMGLSAAGDGLRVDLDGLDGLPGGGWIQPADVPDPLPVASAGAGPGAAIAGFDGRPLRVQRVASLPVVPRAGTDAVLTDLEYADRLAVSTGQTPEPQVWLSADAPADARERLTAQGLVVVGDVRANDVRDRLDRQGPALALGFFVLAAGLVTALAAGALVMVAAVDRVHRVTDLTALRAQGLSRTSVARATRWTYPVLAGAAVLAGLPIAGLLWWLTGSALPLAGMDAPPLVRPEWPRLPVAAAVVLVVLLVLAAAAYAGGRRIRREVP